MKQNRVAFFVIVGLAVMVVLVMVAAALLWPDSLDEVSPLAAEDVDIEVLVASGIKGWVDDAAADFNESQRNIHVTIREASDLLPSDQLRGSASRPPPAAWLAEASFVLALAEAQEGTFNFDDPQPTAGSTMAWGAYNDKLTNFTEQYGELSWETINQQAGDSGFKLVMESPQNSAEGMAALISATAATQQIDPAGLTSGDVGQADSWLTETFGNGNAQLISKPAITMKSVQGRSIGDAALLSMAAWRAVDLDENSNFTVTPAEPAIPLDYPFALNADSQLPDSARQAAADFREFLLTTEQQAGLVQYGFEPAASATEPLPISGDTVRRLLNWSDRVLY